jgi:endonuclease III
MNIKKELKTTVAATVTLLEQKFGCPENKLEIKPLDNLMLTILSQNTNDKNRDLAYQRLRERFPTWEQVMTADIAEIGEAIKPAGLWQQKSQRIRDILIWINKTYGRLNIDFLCEMTPQEAIDLFCTQKGIGVKTISVVLLFSCGIDIFPVDTHVHRLCRRIGLVPDNVSAEKTFWLMKDLVPKGKSLSLHINLLKLGRTICLARKPNCPQCPLNKFCEFSLQAPHMTK